MRWLIVNRSNQLICIGTMRWLILNRINQLICTGTMRWRAGTTPRPVNLKLRDFGRVPYDLYGVKYIDLVSLGVNPGSQS